MKKKLISILQYVFFLGLGIWLIWRMIAGMSPQELAQFKEAFSHTKFALLIPVTITLLIAHFARAMRWKILMQPLGYNPTNTNTFLAVMIGYFFNLFVPRLGEVMKCTVLAKYEKTPPDMLVGTIVAERAFDVVCLGLVFILTIFTQLGIVGEFAGQIFGGFVKGKAGSMDMAKLFLLLAICFFVLAGLWFLYTRLKHTVMVKKVRSFLTGIKDGLLSITKVQKKGWFLFHTVLIWFMYFLSIYIGFYAFTAIPHLGIGASLSVLTFGSVGMVIPTPGGVGAYQYMLQKVLPLYGVSEVLGFAFGNILWAAQTVILIITGVIALLLMPVINRGRKGATAS